MKKLLDLVAEINKHLYARNYIRDNPQDNWKHSTLEEFLTLNSELSVRMLYTVPLSGCIVSVMANDTTTIGYGTGTSYKKAAKMCFEDLMQHKAIEKIWQEYVENMWRSQ
jgi:hypothetical protein